MHVFEEHTGEVRLTATAPSREELFAETGRALAELMLGDVPAPPPGQSPQRIEVQARDPGGLLVAWLNELIFLAETSKQVFTRFEVDRADDTTVQASAWGIEPEALKTAVKAATFHGLRFGRKDGGWSATVVVDV